MAFHFGARCHNVHLPHPLAFAPVFNEPVTQKDGRVVDKFVPSNIPLPSADTTDLETLIDAGLPLQMTNSKVLQPDFDSFVSLANEFEGEEEEKTTQTTQQSEV